MVKLTNFINRVKLINWKKVAVFTAVILVVLVVLGFLGIVRPAQKLMADGKQAMVVAQELGEAAKTQNIVTVSEKIGPAKEKVSLLQKDLQSFAWVKFVPVANGYYADAEHAMKAGIAGLEVGQIAVESILPYADLLGLKGKGTFTGGTAEERIMQTVKTLDKITPKIDEIIDKAKIVKSELDQINPNRYPEKYKGIMVREKIRYYRSLVDEGVIFLAESGPVIKRLPEFLGEPKAKRYLILFQNDKELRPTGGFLTAYAVFRVEHGKIIAERSDDIYKLDATIGNKPRAPEPILKYLPNEYVWHLRNTNLSPDFAVSMGDFWKIYQQSSERVNVDGIVAIDTQFVTKIMDVIGVVKAYGIEFSTKKVPECDCPMIIYELEKYADQPVAYERGSRKDMIGVLMGEMMRIIFQRPGGFGPVFQAAIEAMNEKHLLVWIRDPEIQKVAESLNAAGRIKDYEGDYLHINDANFGGAKANMYVKQAVEQKIEVGNDGVITKTVTLKYNNYYAGSDCDLEHGQLCLNAPLRNWIRVYVPKGSTLIEGKGSEVKIITSEDLGKTVFEGFFVVRPKGSAQMQLKYRLPFKARSGDDLKMLIQKQPGTEEPEYTINTGKKTEKFKLLTDKELVLPL